MNGFCGVRLGALLAGIGRKSGAEKKGGGNSISLTRHKKAHLVARWVMLLLMLSFQLELPVAMANPTGGQVASGAATINTGQGNVTVNQTTNAAVINWQSFSIGAGEVTKFIQPSSASATLNRVLGGQTSIINGTLSANGQVYLLNGNGILVGPNGVINTAGFIGSTRNLSDSDFAAGNLHFTGNNDAGVTNLGKISALGGDVILIGKTVDNQGSISAPNGHVGMAAADDVLVTQSGLEHVFVRATANPTSAAGKTGVNNAGSIAAASAELKAANGNIYALATNNSGIIRATGVTTQDGHIWLVAEGNQGVTKNTGELIARKAGGAGGDVETSGGQVIANGTVDVGGGGTWLIDPSDINIDGTTASTIVATLNGGGIVTEDSSLGSGGNGDITVSAAINWTGTGVLNLFAYRNLTINSAITGNNGSLNLLAGSGGVGTITVPAAISVKNFNLQGGNWIQNAITLPSFYANNFTISGGSFLRVNGGSGVTGDPYQLRDIYGLQGIGSNAAYEAANWRVVTTIDASGVANWNNGAGFVPISNFTGVFDGNGSVGAISGLTINLPGQSNVGLFGQIGTGGSVSNVVLNNVNISGLSNVGALAGINAGQVNTSSANGTVSGGNSAGGVNIGGLLGSNSGNVSNSFAAVSVTGYGNTGGLIGANSGLILSSYATGTVSSYNNVTVSGSGIGGLAGSNNGGSVVLSYATGRVNASDSFQVGGLIGASTGAAVIQQSYAKGVKVSGYQDVGGLVGYNGASSSVLVGKLIDGSGSAFSTVSGAVHVGGLVGNNAGSITQSSVLGSGSVVGQDLFSTAANSIGGVVGYNSGNLGSSFSSITVGQAAGSTDTQYVGGLAGFNSNTGIISGVYSTGNVSGYQNIGGLVGQNNGALGVQSNASGTVTGSINVGGLIGYNSGSLGEQSFSTSVVTGGTSVGGLIGYNNTTFAISKVYAQGSVKGVSNVGGLVGNNAAGNFSLSNATGNVTGSSMNIGGLMGQNSGKVTTSYASGTVIASTATNVGGLVGSNSGTIGTQSYASGAVNGKTAVGGLVGSNSGVVGDDVSIVESLSDYTKATGNVTGQSSVGGLVGDNLGTVRQATASGLVKGSGSASNVGGLVGSNENGGIITVSFATGTVQGNGTSSTSGTATDTNVGGLVGMNAGQISLSYAVNSVIGDNVTGGLVGLNSGSNAVIQTSYSTGTVTGLLAVGGLAGQNQQGLITQNYSISTVKGRTNVGGLVGLNQDRISENYATGAVTGTTNVGGLVGQNASGASLTQSYATGTVSVSGTGLSGGLIGLNSGTVANSYWDQNSTTTGTRGIGNDVNNTGATGLTSTGTAPSAFSVSSYSGLGTAGSVADGASNAVGITDGASNVAWYMLDGQTRPFLAWEAPINNPVSNGAHLVYTAHQLQLMAVNLSASYVLGKDVNLSETSQLSSLWNSASGFVSIGTYVDPFSGSFSGGSFNISNLYINTPSASYVGLFGVSSGSLSSISLGGVVIGLDNVGLLAGLNLGTIHGVSVSGSVSGNQNVGGLVGSNQDSISSFAVNASVSANSNAGGVTGSNSGLVQDGYSLGNVSGSGAAQSNLGGLVGLNSGTVTVAYATGSVTGNSLSANIGGDVGRNTNGGVISQVYSTGVVSGGTNVGGVAGSVDNGSSILQSYSTGTVKGGTNIGGVAGVLSGTSQINSSYASGKVSGTTAVGGLLGLVQAASSYANLFWDSSNATKAVGVDGNPGSITDLHGKTINGNTSIYSGFDTGVTPGFSTGVGGSSLVYGSSDLVWRIQSGWEFPLLTQLSTEIAGTAYSNAAHTIVASGAVITLNSGTNLLNTTTSNASGAYVFLFAADDGLFNYLPRTGKTIRISDAAHHADSIAASNYNNNGVPSLLADIAPADTWANTVRVVSNGLNNGLLAQAGSAFITISGSNNFGGTNLNISENFEVGSSAIINSYTIDGDITVQGNVTFDSNGNVADGYNHTVTLYAQSGTGNTSPIFTLNAALTGDGVNRVYIVETDGNFVNNVGTGAFQTPNGSWLVYSQNPEGSNQSVEDDTGGLNQYHLYGTNFTETPAYLLAPDLNYQIYSFTPTLTLTAVAAGADPATGSVTVQYGTATPGLTYIVSGLLAGDTVTAGQTFNQVLSNQPGEQTVYAKYSGVGDYVVSFIGSTLPTSLIGYNLVFNSGNIHVEPNSSEITISVSGNQSFGYIGSGQHFVVDPSSSQLVLDDPNLGFVTTVGQYANVGTYLGTISLNATSQANYSNVHLIVNDSGYTVSRAQITISAYGTSIYGDAINNPQYTSGQSVYDSSGNIVSLSSAITASGGFSYANPGVTSASNVGSYGFAVSGPSNPTAGALSNYTITFAEGDYDITPRALVINATKNETYNYDGTPGLVSFGTSDYSIGATAAGTGLVNGDKVIGLMGRVDNSNPNVAHYNYTQGTLTAADSSGNASSNYIITYNNNGYGLDITPRAITIEAIKDSTKVYGNSDPAFTYANGFYTITAGSLASGENFSSNGSLGRQSGENVNGGTVYQFNGIGSVGIVNSGNNSTTSNYTITFVNPDGHGLTITKAPLTVTASNQTITYSGTTYSGGNGVSYSGFKFSDNASSLGGALAYGGSSQGAINVGTYNIVPSGYTSGNYTISYVNGSLKINPATLTITAVSGSRTYDATAFSGSFGSGITISGFKGSDNLSNALTGSAIFGGSAQGAINAGTYTITVSGFTANNGNYTINYVSGNLIIGKAPLTVTADNKSKVYGATDPLLTYTPSGQLYGEDTYSVISGVNLSTVTGQNATGGTHVISVTGATATNYAITMVPGTLTVTPAPITITVLSGSSTYGDSPSNPGLSATGLQYGENASVLTGLSNSFGITNTSNANTYTLTLKGTLTNPNYSYNAGTDVTNGSWVVNPAALTITAKSGTKIYGDIYTLTGSSGFTSNGLKNSETIGSVSLASSGTGATANVAGSPYVITISNATGGSFNINNYTITYVNGALTVNPAALSVTAKSGTKIYGDLYTALTGTEFTISGLKNGETATTVILSSTGASTTANVSGSPYAIVIGSLSGGTFDPNNYTITYHNGNLTVNKALLTITANSGTKVYGDTYTLSGTAFSSSGLKNGETVGSVTLTSGGTGATANVTGTGYAITGTNATGGTFNSGNYAITYLPGTLTVTPAPITITVLSGSSIYGNSSSNPGLSATGLKNGQDSSVLTGLSNSFGISATSGVGSYTLTLKGTLTNANYSYNASTDVTNGSWSVTPAALTITANSGTKVYGDTYILSGTAFSSNGLKNGETIGSVQLASSGTGATANVTGSPYVITIGSAAGGSFNTNNYTITYVNGSLTVKAAPLTITANSGTKTYGDTYVLSGTAFGVSGLKNGETVGTVDLISDGAAATANVNGSPYAIVASNLSGGTFDPNNYAITYVNGSLTVNRAALTITANSGTKVYGDTYTLSGSTGFSSSGLKNGETIGSVALTSGGTGATANVTGTGYAITGTNATGGTFSSGNYTITYLPGTLTVTPAPVNITVLSGSSIYGSSPSNPGLSATGLKNGQTVSSLTGISNSFGITPTSGVNTYTLSVAGSLTNGNYQIVGITNGSWIVNPAALTITANSGTKTYGDTYLLSGTAFSSNGLKNGETIGSVILGSSGTGATANVNGSPYAITIGNASGGSFNANNYTITYVNGGLTVNPAALTVTANSGTKTYGDTYVLSGTAFGISGLKNGETVGTVSLTSDGAVNTANVNGSPYAIVASNLGGGTFDPNNYTITYVNGSLTVNRAALTITANSGTKTYGDTYTLSGTAFSSSGLKNGETIGSIALSSTGAAASANVNGSPYAIIAGSATGGSFDINNYSVTYQNGSLTVNPAQVIVTALSGSSIYGDSPSNPGLSASGLKNGQDISVLTGLSNSFGINNTTNAGNHTLQVDGELTNANYTVVSTVNGTWIVNRAALTVTANSGSKTYGDTYTLSGTAFSSSGLKNGETIGSVQLASSGTGATASVGSSPYSITVSDAAGGSFNSNNYDITYVNGSLVVGRAALTITANSGSKTYGDTYTLSGTAFSSSGLKNGESIGSVVLSSTGAAATANVNGSPYSIIASDAAGGSFDANNYSITYVNGSLVVGRAALTITANSGTKTYGDTYILSGSTGFSSSGLKNEESIGSVQLASDGAVATANVNGSPYTVTIDSASGGSFNANNYTVTYVNGSLTVNPAKIIVTALGGSSTYGDSPSNPGLSVSGLKNGQDVSVLTGLSNSFGITNTTGAGDHTLQVDGELTNANYTVVSTVDGNWTVNRAALTITANSGTKTYGDVYTALTGTEFGSSGLKNGETIGSISLSSTGAAATANVNGSPYVINASDATGGSFDINNYSVTYVNGSLTVNPAQIIVTALGGSSTYGDSPSNPGLSASGLKNGQDVSVLTGLSNSFGINNTTNAGNYDLSVNGELTNANYTVVSTVDGSWTVNRAALTITANSGTKTYGDIYTALTGTEFGSSGLKNGETIGSISLSSTGAAATANVNGSPYVINASDATGGSFDINNYSVTYVNGSLTVNPAQIIVTALGGSSTYGDSPSNPGLSASGLKNGQDVSVLTGLSNSFGINNITGAGDHTLQVDGELTNANYTVVSTVDGNWTVNRAALTITANSGTKTYGDVYTALTGTEFSSSGLKNGENIGSVDLSSDGAAASANVTGSPYVVNIGNAVGGSFDINNYSVTYVNGSLTVNPAQIIVTALGGSSVYGTSPLNPGLSASGLKNGQDVSVLTGLNNSFNITNNTNAGSYDLSVNGELTNANYTVVSTVGGNWTVNKAALTVTADPQKKMYGDTFVFGGTEFTVIGLLNEDTLTQVGLTSGGTPALATPGKYAVLMTPDSAVGYGLSNYNINFVSALFTVTPTILGQPSIPRNARTDYEQLVRGLYQYGSGAWHFYNLEVPGSMQRAVSDDGFSGIAAGSSVMNMQIGLDSMYDVDRFQTYRH